MKTALLPLEVQHPVVINLARRQDNRLLPNFDRDGNRDRMEAALEAESRSLPMAKSGCRWRKSPD